jgi:hypothetical protein
MEGLLVSGFGQYCEFFQEQFISSSFLAKLRKAGFNPGHVAAQRVQPRRFLKLRAGLLQPQVENLLADVPAISQQFRLGLFLNLFSL